MTLNSGSVDQELHTSFFLATPSHLSQSVLWYSMVAHEMLACLLSKNKFKKPLHNLYKYWLFYLYKDLLPVS